jgi:hypothetical protein
MKIMLTPMRRDDDLILQRAGDALVINGESFDFAALPEGGILPRDAISCDFIASDVTRTNGRLHMTLVLPHGPHARPDALFPAPILIENDGPISLPSLQTSFESDATNNVMEPAHEQD